jgi:hypothetical protein
MGSCGEVGWLWFPRMSGRRGRREDLKWLGVFGSLVLGEQKQRTLGDGGCVSKKISEVRAAAPLA